MDTVNDPPVQTPPDITTLSPATLYFNRELSWLAFNERVLQQAADARHPLLDRVRFLAIFSNNLSEFYMVRVGGLTALTEENIQSYSIDGQLPAQQLRAIQLRMEPLITERTRLWEEVLHPALENENIRIYTYDEVDAAGQAYLNRYFDEQLYPILTPLAVDPGRPFPHISNLSLNLALELEPAPGRVRFARIKIPPLVPRLIQIPNPQYPDTYQFIWIEEVIRAHAQQLFPGVSIKGAYTFRLVRDADAALAEGEASDLMLAMENHLRRRNFGRVVQLEVENGTPPFVSEMLLDNLEASARATPALNMPPPLDFTALFELVDKVDRSDLKAPPFQQRVPPYFSDDEKRSIFAVIRDGDRLLDHPYDSFEPVLDFIESAAEDPDVVAIKITLYRMGKNPRIIDALLQARRNGKQVAVLVELKARFDEENNIKRAEALEAEGVHVVYGLVGLKTHSKITLVVRREKETLRRYVHIGTGNYNATTSRLYTDIGLFTCRPEVGEDASDLFNYLTGFSNQTHYKTLLVAPVELRRKMIALIEREGQHTRAGRLAGIFIKMNALTDRTMINALYGASQAGVETRLIVRGPCSLRPQVEGISDRIEVRSVIGRFLEHSRIFYFENGGEPEVYIGSADYMGRNLDRRVEVAVRLHDPTHKDYLLNKVLHITWNDTVNNYRLHTDGHYESLAGEEPPLNSHEYLLALHHSIPTPKASPLP